MDAQRDSALRWGTPGVGPGGQSEKLLGANTPGVGQGTEPIVRQRDRAISRSPCGPTCVGHGEVRRMVVAPKDSARARLESGRDDRVEAHRDSAQHDHAWSWAGMAPIKTRR